MAEEILSSLGFTVDDALAALTKLDSVFKVTFDSMASVLTAWNAKSNSTVIALDSITAAAKRAQTTMSAVQGKTPGSISTGTARTTSGTSVGASVNANIGDAAEKVAKVKDETEKADKSTQSWVLSWKTMGRVVTTQLIVRTLSEIRNALGEAISGAVEFQTKIAEIRTIAPALDRDFGALGREVADFSTKFNFPLPQAAEAVYQSLSNQFVTASERADIMKAAAELAKVGVMSLSDAVLLLTGTLNAYGKSSSEAETVAAKFFTTIRLGRVRGEELVQVVGKLMPMAAALGVSLDSVNSEMVGLTIGGMKSAEASTALRGGMTAMIKPSEALKKELHNLGYESGQQMIAALGLQGAFLRLGESAEGDVAKLGTMFRNVRGLNAELRLTGAGAAKAAEAFDAMQSSTAENLQTVYAEFRTTEAEKFTMALNEIKVYLATELGPELIKILNTITKFAGGADTLKAAFSGLMAAGVPLVIGLSAIAIGLLVVSANAKLAGTSLSFLTTAFSSAILPISLTIGSIIFLNEKLATKLKEAWDSTTKSIEDAVARQQADADVLKSIREKQDTEQLAQLEQYASKLRQSYNAIVDSAKIADAAMISSSKATMESMIADVQRMAGVYRAQANTEIQESRKAAQAKIAAETEYSSAVFGFTERHKSAWDKVMDYSRRARQEGVQGAKELAKAMSPEQATAARSKISQAQADAQSAMSAAGADTFLEEEAQKTIVSLIRQKGEAEGEYASKAMQVSHAATKAAADEQSHANVMKALMPKIIKDMELFGKTGPKSSKDRAKLIADTKKDIDAYQKEWAASGQMSAPGLLNWTEFKEKLKATMEGGVSNVEIQGFLATPDSLKALNEQISKGIGPIEVFIKALAEKNPEFAKKIEGKTAPEALNIATGMGKSAQEERAKYISQSTDIAKAEKAVQGNAALLGAVLEVNNALLHSNNPDYFIARMVMMGERVGSAAKNLTNLTEANKTYDYVLKTFQQIKEHPAIATMEQMVELQTEVSGLKEKGGLSSWDVETLDRAMMAVKAIATEQDRIKLLRSQQEPQKAKTIASEQTIQDIDAAKKAQEDLGNKTSSAADKTQSIGDAADNAKTALQQMANVDFSGLISQISAAMGAMSVLSQSQTMTAANGGVAYLANGGRGTDTISAMLTPGEMVMNPSAAGKFATQLSAMNAGIQPTYNQESKQTTIGDINITVQGGKTGQQTVREIAAGMRRELRRGTIV